MRPGLGMTPVWAGGIELRGVRRSSDHRFCRVRFTKLTLETGLILLDRTHFFLSGLALSPQVNSEIARQLVDAYLRLYPPYYDSSAGGQKPYMPAPW